MKRAVIIANERAEHQRTWGSAFAEGLKRHGWRVTTGRHHQPADLVVQWGIRRQDWIDATKHAGGEVVVLERGYVGDRFAWTSVSFGGGLNGRATFRGPFHDASRWNKHFAHLMQPWQSRDSGVALICGQVATDAAVAHVDINQFYQRAQVAYAALGIETLFRPHPLANRLRPQPSRPLAEDLARAAVAVTFNSNSGVEAVLAGVPTVAIDKGSMAWDVTGHELTLPPTPDRTAWAHALAWKQWQMDEIADGTCWAHVGRETVAA